MKHLIYIYVAAGMLFSCDLVPSSNGDFDGFWQMTSVDTLSNGNGEDTRESLVFWSVQKRLLEMKHLATTGNRAPHIFFRFERGSDRLVIYDPIIDNRDSSDLIVKDTSCFNVYGIDRVPDTLKIVTLTNDRMVLYTNRLKMTLRKY